MPTEDIFEPKDFLAKVGAGRTILEFRKNQHVFEQGDVADTVFYIQKGKVKLTVLSEQGKEAVVAILGGAEPAAHQRRDLVGNLGEQSPKERTRIVRAVVLTPVIIRYATR